MQKHESQEHRRVAVPGWEVLEWRVVFGQPSFDLIEPGHTAQYELNQLNPRLSEQAQEA